MTKATIASSDSLSALMDAELYGPEKELILAQLLSSPQVQAQWHAFHVMGDVLRSDGLAGAASDWQFLAKLEARVANEPRAVHETAVAAAAVTMPWLDVPHVVTASANAALFKWRAVAGAACTVLVAVLGALLWVPPPASSSLASSPVTSPIVAQAVFQTAPDGMIRDPRLNQLLSAHQQLGGHSALQMPSGFLRNATYDGDGR